jgi:hypothetical protein
MRARRTLLWMGFAAAAAAAGLAGMPAAAELWMWTDGEGVERYTPDPDRVPAGLRHGMVRVEPGMPGPARQAAPTPPVAGLVEADPWNAPERANPIEATDVPEPRAPAPSPEVAHQALPAVAPPLPPQKAPAPRAATTPPPPEAPPPAPPATPPAPGPPTEPAPPPEPTPQTEAAPAPQVAPAPTPQVPPAPEPTPAPQVARAPEPEPPAPPPVLTPEQQARREELLALIAKDEEALKVLISGDDSQVESSAELREIAQRLPTLQAELKALEAGQAPAPEAP